MMTPAQVTDALRAAGLTVDGASYDQDAPVMETVEEPIMVESFEPVLDEKGGATFDEKGRPVETVVLTPAVDKDEQPLMRKVTRPVKTKEGEVVTEDRWELSFPADTSDEDKAAAYEALAALDTTATPEPKKQTLQELAADTKGVASSVFLEALRAKVADGTIKL